MNKTDVIFFRTNFDTQITTRTRYFEVMVWYWIIFVIRVFSLDVLLTKLGKTCYQIIAELVGL